MPFRWTAAGLVPDFSDSSDDEGGDERERPCEVCANLDRNIVAPWTRSGDHYFSIRDIRPSALKAQQGICYTCTIVGGGLTQFRNGWEENDGQLCINIIAYDDSSRPLLVQLARPVKDDTDVEDDDDDNEDNEDDEGNAEDMANEDKVDHKSDEKPPPVTTAPAQLVMEFYAEKAGMFELI
jgi:hypothetical protein